MSLRASSGCRRSVELDQVEGAEHGGMVVVPVAEEIEDRETLSIDDDGLAIDHTGFHRQTGDCHGDLWETDREVIAIACE